MTRRRCQYACLRPVAVFFDGPRCALHSLPLGDEPARRFAEMVATLALPAEAAGVRDGRATSVASVTVREPAPLSLEVAS